MPSELKTLMTAELKETFGSASDLAFFDYSGLTATDAHDLRATLHKIDGRISVVKNSLMKLAMPEELCDTAPEIFTGPLAVAHGDTDASAILKALLDWAKDNRREIALKGGIVDGRPVSADELKLVARLPSRDELRAQLLATIAAPMTTLLRLLNEPRRRMVAILDQKAKKGQADGPAVNAG